MVYKYSSWGLANKHNWGTTLYHWDHPGDLKIGEANQKTKQTGWWLTYPSAKYESQLGYYSQYMEKT